MRKLLLSTLAALLMTAVLLLTPSAAPGQQITRIASSSGNFSQPMTFSNFPGLSRQAPLMQPMLAPAMNRNQVGVTPLVAPGVNRYQVGVSPLIVPQSVGFSNALSYPVLGGGLYGGGLYGGGVYAPAANLSDLPRLGYPIGVPGLRPSYAGAGLGYAFPPSYIPPVSYVGPYDNGYPYGGISSPQNTSVYSVFAPNITVTGNSAPTLMDQPRTRPTLYPAVPSLGDAPRARPSLYPAAPAAAISANSSLFKDPPTKPDTTALIRVVLAQADAQVWFEGVKTNRTGVEREFISPPLEEKATYNYEIRVRWGEGAQSRDVTRSVRVRAGDRLVVDFTAPTGN